MKRNKITFDKKVLLEELGDQWTKMGEGFTEVAKAFNKLPDKIAKAIKEIGA